MPILLSKKPTKEEGGWSQNPKNGPTLFTETPNACFSFEFEGKAMNRNENHVNQLKQMKSHSK